MGFYQLSRLYYCFANAQIHSSKGYPTWIFIIMHSIAICLIPIGMSALVLSDFEYSMIRSDCGFNNHFEYYYYPLKYKRTEGALYLLVTAMISYLTWDITTLLMFIFKIIAFNKVNAPKNTSDSKAIYQRIMSILSKIIIMTLFYDLLIFCCSTIPLMYALIFGANSDGMGAVSATASVIAQTAVSCSMYLMMDHNEKEYERFLKIIYYSRLHWICCKWRYIVTKELNKMHESREHIDEVVQVIKQEESTIFDTGTHNISALKRPTLDIKLSTRISMELSAIKEVPGTPISVTHD